MLHLFLLWARSQWKNNNVTQCGSVKQSTTSLHQPLKDSSLWLLVNLISSVNQIISSKLSENFAQLEKISLHFLTTLFVDPSWIFALKNSNVFCQVSSYILLFSVFKSWIIEMRVKGCFPCIPEYSSNKKGERLIH